MPAKAGGGLKKGRAGKKMQIEKMIETAKKNQPDTMNRQRLAAKPGNGPKPVLNNANCASTQKLRNGFNKIQAVDRSVNGTIPKQPVIFKSSKMVVVRLPGQGSIVVPTKLPILYTQHAPIAATLPKAFQNPNHVVVCLPPKQPSKEPTTFETLPNEIRNSIYDLAMPSRKYGLRFIQDGGQHSKELTYYLPLSETISVPQLTVKDGERRRLFDLPKRLYIDKAIPPYHLSPGPAALLLVSKKVNEDTTPILYGRNTFSFHAITPLRKLLNALRPGTRSMVRSLEIRHHTAGDPKETSNQMWKDIYDHSWNNLCFQIRDQCTALASLALDLTINDVPFHMGPLANWMSPLYAFMNLGHLKEVNLRLHQSHTKDAVLKVQAYEIRKELMGANYYEPSTSPTQIFVEKPKARARPGVNSLRITGSMGNQSPPRQTPAPNNRYAGMTTEQCMELPTHLLPNQRPSLGPGATVFWHPPSPTNPSDDHPLYHKKGSRGEQEAIRKMQLKYKKERLEKKEMAQAQKMKKLKAKA